MSVALRLLVQSAATSAGPTLWRTKGGGVGGASSRLAALTNASQHSSSSSKLINDTDSASLGLAKQQARYNHTSSVPLDCSRSFRLLAANRRHRLVYFARRLLEGGTTIVGKRLASRPIRRSKQPVGVTKLGDKFNMVWPKITLFGDSLTRRAFDVNEGCWGSMLANKVGDYFDVDARGFAGYNTRWALAEMPKLFPKHYLNQVEIFVLLFGHNDSWEPSNPLSIPVDEYEKNVNLMIQYLLNNGLTRSKIILITPNWYHKPAFDQYHIDFGYPPTKKEFADTVKYGEAIIRIARKEQIDFIDAFALSYRHDPLAELYCDGVHYSKKGAQLLFEHLWPVVDRKIADSFRKATSQLFHATPWDEIPPVKASIEAHTKKLEEERRSGRGY